MTQPNSLYTSDARPFARTATLWPGAPEVCRLGLAARGNTHLAPEDVRHALDRGVNCLNWCGQPDGLSQAVRELSPAERSRVVVIAQITARDYAGMRDGLDAALREVGHGYLDCVTLYYIESREEWARVSGPDGALPALKNAKTAGRIRAIGLTSHQRPLAAEIARTGELDLLMIRYNAAHRGAEAEVFPVTEELGLPVVTYTGLRWGDLLKPTPEDPPGFSPPPAPEWYRFVLTDPRVLVGVMAPNDRAELEEDLALLDDWRAPSAAEYATLVAHGERVHRSARGFW